jgi:hypothetical protein
MMRAKDVIVLSLLTLGMAALQGCAPKQPVSDLTEKPERFANQRVTVAGTVLNSQALTPRGPDDFKGEFDLSDDSGIIHVKTRRNPPANGVWRKVTGLLDVSVLPPLLVEGQGLSTPLMVALGVLVIVAVVLVVLLVSRSRGTDGSGNGPPPPPPPPGVKCPKCGEPNDADAKYCEHCGKALKEPEPPGPTVVVGPETAGRGDKPTTVIPIEPEERPLADLTVIDGPGAKYGTRFELQKHRQKIGRADGMGIRLLDDTVSREHASIWWDDGVFYIQDEASKGGTLVNGETVARHVLADDDLIQLGKTKLVFRVLPGVPKSD